MIQHFLKIIGNNKLLIENFSYVTLLQVFILVAPLITYPYLIRILGADLYGSVLTAQMLASYASILIDFGSNNVCAKHVSLARYDKEKLSEILSSVLLVRIFLFFSVFILYFSIVIVIPSFRKYWLLYILTYGLTLNDVLFPQFFFQGLEKMKLITFVNIFIKVFFVILVFFVVKNMEDYIYVPILYALGYTLGGFLSIWILFHRWGFQFIIVKKTTMMPYIKDCMPIFATDLICTIKDKVNYILVGLFVGMSEVVIYDLALKLHSLLTKPMGILTTVLLPRFALTKNFERLKQVILVSFFVTFILLVVTNVFLEKISYFFLHSHIDLNPIRFFLIAPLFVSVGSVISSNLFVAFGYNRYVFTSIVITTGVYVFTLLILLISGNLNSIYSFVALAVISYFVELIYRLYKTFLISKKLNNNER